MNYVRQHYKLATTGKLGQDAPGGTAPKSGGSGMPHSSSSSRKSSSSGSHTKKSGY